MEEKELQESKNILERAESLGVIGSGVDALSGAITSKTLSGNETPINIITPPPSTLAAGITGQTPALMDSLTNQLKADQEAKVAQEKEQKGRIASIMESITGKQQEKIEAIGDKNTPGTPAWEKEQARLLAMEFDKSQRAQLNEIASLESQNLTGAGSQAAQAGINRKYALQQGDLQLKYHIAQGDYNASIETLNQKFELELEPLKLQLEQEQNVYDQIRNDLTKSEDRLWTAKINETNQAIADRKQTQADIANIFTTLQTNNPDILKRNPALISQLSNAKTTLEATQILARAGISLQNPLERQIQEATLAEKYQNIAESKAKATQALTALPGPIQTRVQGIAGQFDAEQAVKNYQVSAEAIDAVKNSGVTPTDDIGRIYAFAKVMDPNSVVREGEYKTVQDYSTALLERTGLKARRIFDNAGFLTQEARTFMKTTLDNRLASSKKAVDNIYNEYGRRINKVTGRTDGTDYITDYGKAFETSGGVLMSPDGTQQVDTSELTPEQVQEAKDAGWQ